LSRGAQGIAGMVTRGGRSTTEKVITGLEKLLRKNGESGD